MEKHVTSLELSKKLKELGVPQNAYWCWYTNDGSSTLMHNPEGYRSMEDKTFDAFLSSELGEKLPNWVFTVKDESNNFYCYASAETYAEYHRANEDTSPAWGDDDVIGDIADTEANARAKMLIYLIEQKLLDVNSLK